MEPEKKSNGALVGLVIIIIILVVGGLYMWQAKKKSDMEKLGNLGITSSAQDAADLNGIEQELGNVDTNVGVDANSVK